MQKEILPVPPVPQPTAETKPKKKVLIVEDDVFLLDMYADKFTHDGFVVFKAKNGQEGLDLLKSHQVDAAVIDLMMPVLDGKSMLHQLRELPDFRTLPVIILTNAGQVDNIRETQRLYDATAFFIKSNTELNELVRTVKSATG